MGMFLQAGDFPDLDPRDVTELINELEAHLSLHYPYVTADLPPEKVQILQAILTPVIRRWEDAGTGLTSQDTTGPFVERKSGGGGHVLWQHEKDALRALGGLQAGHAGPKGNFPSPEPITDLFVRRPGWP